MLYLIIQRCVQNGISYVITKYLSNKRHIPPLTMLRHQTLDFEITNIEASRDAAINKLTI